MYTDKLTIPYWQKFLVTIRTAELMEKQIDCATLYKGYRIMSSTTFQVVGILEKEGLIKTHKSGRNRYIEMTPKGNKMADGLMVLNGYIYSDVDTYLRIKHNNSIIKKKRK